MPYLLEDLVVDRVDLVDEGANSAAFIELYKRKGQGANMDIKEILNKMKPEHSAVIQAELDKLSSDVTKSKESLATVTTERDAAVEDLKKANTIIGVLKANKPKDSDTCTCDGEADENGTCKVCGKPKPKPEQKKKSDMDETETLKSMPPAVRAMFTKMREQKEAAEEEVRKAKEAEKTAEAVAKAAELKALPIETDKLVGVLKTCSKDTMDMLTTINAAIEGTVLGEVGKGGGAGVSADADAAWAKIDAKASEVVKRDNVTKQKAVATVIKENPELYKEYLQGGAN